MSLDSEKKVLPESTPESGAENTTKLTKHDIAATLNDGNIEEMKKKYGMTQDSFIEGVRASKKYGQKAKDLGNNDVITLAAGDPILKEYYNKYINKRKKETEAPSSLDEQQQKTNPEEHLLENDKGEKFDQKTYEKIQKEKWAKAAQEYADKRKMDLRSAEQKVETPKEAPKQEDKKPEAPKEEIKTAEKPAEPKKEPEKKPDDKPKEEKKEKKSFRKKLNPKNWFPKKEKKEKEAKEKKPGFFSKVGSWIGKGIKAIPHQTWNAVSYLPRVARSSIKYVGFDRINHGLNKPGLKKNQDNYASKWKWEQGEKKK